MTATNSKSFVHYQTLPMAVSGWWRYGNFSLTPTLSLRERVTCTQQEQERVKREIRVTDRQIEYAVYELYGLTEDEIKRWSSLDPKGFFG